MTLGFAANWYIRDNVQKQHLLGFVTRTAGAAVYVAAAELVNSAVSTCKLATTLEVCR